MKEKAKKIQRIIDNAKKTAIIVHSNPDGDALGAGLALYHYLNKQGKECTVISPTNIVYNLLWLPGCSNIWIFNNEDKSHQELIASYDTIVFVDHSTAGRCSSVYPFLKADVSNRLFIDHHPSPNIEAEVGYSVTDSAATCCILYQIFKIWQAKITLDMATCMFTGISTDTGNFRYGNNIAEAFSIVANLVTLGIDKEAIIDAIYNTASEDRMRLLGFVLKDKMKLVENRLAYITLSKKELKKFRAQNGDTDDFVNQPLMIKNIEVSAIFIEKDNFIKASFRSRGKFDVNLLARTGFNGGGHRNASGGIFQGTLDEAVDLYIKNCIK